MAQKSPVSHATSRNQALKHGAAAKISEPKSAQPQYSSTVGKGGELPCVFEDVDGLRKG